MPETAAMRYPRAEWPGTSLRPADVGGAWRQSWCVELDQFGVERDCGVKHLRHRAVLLGFAGDLGETCVIEVRHLGTQRQRRFADLKTLAFRFERDRGFCREFVRR